MADRDALPGILTGSRERFDASTDFTVGIEEEYQLLDPATLALTNRFEDVMAAAPEPLRERLAGELIASEVEFRTGRHTTFADAARDLIEGRLATLALADSLGLGLPDWATTVALVLWGVALGDLALLTGIAVLMQGKE